MSTTRYDRYGRAAGYINPIEGAPEAYLIIQADAVTQYICYYETGTAPRAIRRVVTLDNETQVCVGWGVWSDDAATITANVDFYPVNSVFTVDNDSGAVVSVAPYNTPVAPIS